MHCTFVKEKNLGFLRVSVPVLYCQISL